MNNVECNGSAKYDEKLAVVDTHSVFNVPLKVTNTADVVELKSMENSSDFSTLLLRAANGTDLLHPTTNSGNAHNFIEKSELFTSVLIPAFSPHVTSLSKNSNNYISQNTQNSMMLQYNMLLAQSLQQQQIINSLYSNVNFANNNFNINGDVDTSVAPLNTSSAAPALPNLEPPTSMFSANNFSEHKPTPFPSSPGVSSSVPQQLLLNMIMNASNRDSAGPGGFSSGVIPSQNMLSQLQYQQAVAKNSQISSNNMMFSDNENSLKRKREDNVTLGGSNITLIARKLPIKKSKGEAKKNITCDVPGCPYRSDRPALMRTHARYHEGI